MGPPEPLYRGCPSVIARPTLGRARVSLVRTNEVPPTAHLLLVEGLPEPKRGQKRKYVLCQRPTLHPPTSLLTTAEMSSPFQPMMGGIGRSRSLPFCESCPELLRLRLWECGRSRREPRPPAGLGSWSLRRGLAAGGQLRLCAWSMRF